MFIRESPTKPEPKSGMSKVRPVGQVFCTSEQDYLFIFLVT